MNIRPAPSFALTLALLLAASADDAAAQTTSPVTSDVGHFGRSNRPSISANGTRVAYESIGSTSPGDTCIDVHVRDLPSGTVSAIAVCDSTLGGPAWPARNPVLSGDGGHVAYERLAGSPPKTSILVTDVGSGSTNSASVSDLGFLADSACYSPASSHDARHVAFHTTATNLVTPSLPVNNIYNIYVRDELMGRTVCMSEALSGGASIDAHSQYPSISADGRYVAFESRAADLAPPGIDTNATQDVYLRDRDPDNDGVFDEGNATTTLITRNAAGLAATSGGQKAAISADGRFLAFLSYSSDIAGASGNKLQVHVCDRDPDEDGDFSNTDPAFEIVSRSNLGVLANASCLRPSLSSDGRFVAFSSSAGNLVPNDDGDYDAFVVDRKWGQIARVSVDTYGTAGDDDSAGTWYSDDPALSADGTRLAFSSRATNLVAADTNGFEDVFTHDVCPAVAVDLGFSLDGAGGLAPALSVCGDLGPGGSALLRLRDALPLSPAWFVAGPAANPTPFMGGMLVPVPLVNLIAVATDALGGVTVAVPGTTLSFVYYLQFAIADPAGPAGMSLSNAVELHAGP